MLQAHSTCSVLLICNCMLTQKQNMQLGSVKILRVIIFSGWNCHFLVRGGRHLLTSFRNMKNYLQSSGVILLTDQEYGNLDHVDGWLKFPYVSLCVVYFFFSSFFFLFSFLCDSWLGDGSSCFLEVVALSAGEKGGAYGSQDSHQMVSAQRKKETQTRENNGTEQYLL